MVFVLFVFFQQISHSNVFPGEAAEDEIQKQLSELDEKTKDTATVDNED